MKDAVDPHLWDHQAGFRKNISGMDQIAILQIILEQAVGWNTPLDVNFIDYEKVFDSVDRWTIWQLLRHYSVPQKITNIIRNAYEELT